MPDVLSQGEIDALLSALTSGEVSAEEIRRSDEALRVRAYDFKRAMRFSKEHIRSISRIYEHYSRLLSTFFSAQLRFVVQLNVESVEQVPYEEFIRSVPPVTVLHVINVPSLQGKFLIEVAPNVAYAMLDRVLGGAGASQDGDRRLTEIDTVVLERLFSRSLSSMTVAWGSIADLQFGYDSLEINPQFIQIANQSDVVLVVSLSISIGNVTGTVNVCMPHVALEPLMSRLSARFVYASPRTQEAKQGASSQTLSKHMNQVEVFLKAELGYGTITVNDLLELSPGDVITLDQSVSESLFIRVGGEVKYRGDPGTHRGRYAVKITQVVEDGGTDE